MEHSLIGHTWKQVFNIVGGNPYADHDVVSANENDVVAKTVFVHALSKINKKNQLQQWSAEEFEEAAKLFEIQDGIITVDQFRKYSKVEKYQ